MWNTRLGFEHSGLEFWLSSIACHSPKAPIFIIGTHADQVIDHLFSFVLYKISIHKCIYILCLLCFNEKCSVELAVCNCHNVESIIFLYK